jgi:hypothetical protein
MRINLARRWRRLRRRFRPLFAIVGAAALLAAGCGAAEGASPSTATSTPTASASPAPGGVDVAQIRADAYAVVAQRLYREEAAGPAGRRNAARIARDQRFLGALESGRAAAIRAAALHELFLPVKHVVRIRVVRGGHTVVDVGGSFVSGSEGVELRAPNGADLGRLEISMQDILGLTKLVRRLTPAEVIVRGRAGHVLASPPSLANVSLPRSGRVTIGGRQWAVSSFTRTGFAGEPLRISVLVPA